MKTINYYLQLLFLLAGLTLLILFMVEETFIIYGFMWLFVVGAVQLSGSLVYNIKHSFAANAFRTHLLVAIVYLAIWITLVNLDQTRELSIWLLLTSLPIAVYYGFLSYRIFKPERKSFLDV